MHIDIHLFCLCDIWLTVEQEGEAGRPIYICHIIFYIIFAIFSFIVKLAQNPHNFSRSSFFTAEDMRSCYVDRAKFPVTKFSNSQALAMRLDNATRCPSQNSVRKKSTTIQIEVQKENSSVMSHLRNWYTRSFLNRHLLVIVV